MRRVWEGMEGEDSGEEGAERGGECGCMLDVRGGIVDMADMDTVDASVDCTVTACRWESEASQKSWTTITCFFPFLSSPRPSAITLY